MEAQPEQLSAGRWWRYPTLRNALLSGGIAALGFALALWGEAAFLVFLDGASPGRK
jgi:hypothetical protein